MSPVTRISRFGFVNAYLVAEGDGLTLIDTMLPRSAKPIEEAARRLGAVALLDIRDRTLICGDAYSTLGGVETAARRNPRFPVLAPATWHRPTALDTARALRELDPSRLAPGHGKVVEAPGAAMDAAIARAS
jgi:glyoxylase-like metal-dependent hydrolase (beta-lactamase superfamily II)